MTDVESQVLTVPAGGVVDVSAAVGRRPVALTLLSGPRVRYGVLYAEPAVTEPGPWLWFPGSSTPALALYTGTTNAGQLLPSSVYVWNPGQADASVAVVPVAGG